MAVRRRFLEGLVPGINRSLGTLVRITDALAADGLTPKGLPGGGVGSAHYEDEHFKNTLLATAAEIPAEAVATVMALDGLESVPVTIITDEDQFEAFPAGVRFGDYILSSLNEWAHASPEMRERAERSKLYPPAGEWSAEMIPTIPFASVRTTVRGHPISVQFKADKFLQPHAIWAVRKFEITLPVLAVAGEMLADSLRRRGTLIPNPPTGGKREGDASGSEKAAAITSRRGPSKLQPADQPHSRPRDKAQAMAGEVSSASAHSTSPVSVLGSQVVRGSPPTPNNSATPNSQERQHGRRMDASDPRRARNLHAYGDHAA